MWKVTIENYVWVDIDGKEELKKGKLNFRFNTLEEAGQFVDTVAQHSDVYKFEIECVKGE